MSATHREYLDAYFDSLIGGIGHTEKEALYNAMADDDHAPSSDVVRISSALVAQAREQGWDIDYGVLDDGTLVTVQEAEDLEVDHA